MRWLKILRDGGAEAGRNLIMLSAIAVALFAVTAMLGAYSIVTREVRANYMQTNPASFTIDVDDVTPAILATARAFPGIADAEARSVVEARVTVDGQWMRMLLFVVDDFASMRMNRFMPISGAWPPPEGTILVEREAEAVIGAKQGEPITLKTANGAPADLLVSGFVHDTTLAPAWQEQSGYGYLTMETFRQLEPSAAFEELRVLVSDARDQPAVDTKAHELAQALEARGITVHDIKAPPLGQHPHQMQIMTGLVGFLTLAILALLLATILVAAVLSASLARQIREIGIMKAIGARSSQIAGLYVASLLALGAAAVAIGLPLGTGTAAYLAAIMGNTMNFTIYDTTVPHWVYAVVAASGLLMPLLGGLPSVIRASRTTVREALQGTAATPDFGSSLLERSVAGLAVLGPATTVALRNALRRKGRLVLAVSLLAAGGALFITALNGREGWRAIAASALTDRHYDVELSLYEPVGDARISAIVASSGAVSSYEIWGSAPAVIVPNGGLEIMRTYPDKGHGSFSVLWVPAETSLMTYTAIEGRWLGPGDNDGIVLTQQSHAKSPAAIGEPITISVDGRTTSLKLLGVVREIGGGGAYISRSAFEAIAGDQGRPLIRLSLDTAGPGGMDGARTRLEAAFAAAGIGVERAIPVTTLYLALVGHVEVPVTMLIISALLLGLIGGLGLASIMSINVVERTREIGIMKAIGALPRTILALVVGEGVFIAGLSWLLALVLAVPLTLGLDQIGAMMFGTPLPFIVSLPAILGWLALILIVAAIASAAPAWRAAQLVVRQALVHT
jgi:putative ABC transport system permease protein